MGGSLSLQSQSQPKPRVCIIFFDAGGGHRSTAASLQSVFEQQSRPWELRVLNLREILDPVDTVARITRVRVEDFYNAALRYGITLGSGVYLRVLRSAIRSMHAAITKELRRY